MLLPGRPGRERDGDPGRVIETAVVVDARRQDMRKTQEEGLADMRAAVRRGDRLEDRRSEEAEGARSQEDHQRLGRGLPGLHREVRLHPEN